MADMSTPCIDVHCYHGKWGFPIIQMTTADVLALMERGAVEKAILMSSRAIQYDLVAGNAELAEAIASHPSLYGYVYVNMPELDALAKIDGATLAVTSVPVGDRPGVVVTIPGTDDALVLDRGSASVSIVRPTVDRDERITLPTLPNLNMLTVEDEGRWAVAWFDLTRAVAEAGRDFKTVMPRAARELRGRADGRVVNEIVRAETG